MNVTLVHVSLPTTFRCCRGISWAVRMIGFAVFASVLVDTNAPGQSPPTETVSKTDLRKCVRDSLRREASAKQDPIKAAAAAELCDVYFALRNDPRYQTSEMIRGDAVKVRRRLLSIAKDRQYEQRRRDGDGAAGDNASELIELIQQITAPDFWDVRRGPGAIRYFALRRVLVVRATSEVHEQVRDLLKALR